MKLNLPDISPQVLIKKNQRVLRKYLKDQIALWLVDDNIHIRNSVYGKNPYSKLKGCIKIAVGQIK